MTISPRPTLQELSQSLCRFDKRTIELLLTRAEKNQPPLHLSDLGTAELMETFGRERRHRYYTVSAFRSLAARERLDDSATGYANVDFSVVGGFAVVDPELFYASQASLVTYTDKPKEQSDSPPSRKHKSKNSTLPDGHVKSGYTGKDGLEGVARKGAGKRKRKDIDEGQADDPPTKEILEKRPIGRLRKKPRLDADNHATKSNVERLVISGRGELDSTESATPKKRGRPQKHRPSGGLEEAAGESPPVESAIPKHCGHPQENQPSDVPEGAVANNAGEATSLRGVTIIPKKRGRPRKQTVEEIPSMHSTTPPNGNSAPFSPDSSRPPKRRKPTPSQQVSSPVAASADFPTGVLDLVSMSGGEAVVPESQTEGIRRSARTPKSMARDTSESPVEKGKLSLLPKCPQPILIADPVESQLPARTQTTGSKAVALDSLLAFTPSPPESQGKADISHVNDPVMPYAVDHQHVLLDAAPEVCSTFFLSSNAHWFWFVLADIWSWSSRNTDKWRSSEENFNSP